MNQVTNCPICHSTSIAHYGQLAQPVQDFSIGTAKWESFIRLFYDICRICGAIFQNPMMNEEELGFFYASGVYRDSFSSKNADEDEEDRAIRLAKFLKDRGITPTSHLDVGSSRGMFLETVDAMNQYGVEPFVDYNTNDRAIIFTNLDGLGSMDLASCIHVLEHVSDPLEFLKKMAKTMKDDGYLLIEVPSDMSPGGAMRLSHTYYFTLPFLLSLLGMAKLKAEVIQNTPHWMLLCRKM